MRKFYKIFTALTVILIIISITKTGKELMEQGFSITVPEKPYGAMFMIETA